MCHHGHTRVSEGLLIAQVEIQDAPWEPPVLPSLSCLGRTCVIQEGRCILPLNLDGSSINHFVTGCTFGSLSWECEWLNAACSVRYGEVPALSGGHRASSSTPVWKPGPRSETRTPWCRNRPLLIGIPTSVGGSKTP